MFLNENYTLIDLFNSAGVKTYWLSNQKFLGENETMISSIANRAVKKIYINPPGENKSDGELLHELDKLLKEDTRHKVIFIHLMGTHLSYQDRYPVAFNRFTSKNISPFGDHADSFINHYDNAVLYNDFVVSEIIKRCDALKCVGSTIYFSDHGDEVYDFRDFHGHSQQLLSKYMTSVPFIIYLNKSFKEKKYNSFNNCSENYEKEFSLKQLPNTIQDLLGYESDYFIKSKSFFYNDTSLTNSNNTGVETTIIDNWGPFPEFKSKIWVHRVNSIERFNILQNKFKGMELDVVYKNGKFDVCHPPAVSTGLTLDKFFENVKNIRDYYFWLDLKNLNPENEKIIINKLNFLTKKYNNKGNIIIETINAEVIPELVKANFCPSYYIPDIANINDEERDKEIKKIYKKIAIYKITTISQNIDNYKLMAEYFPKANKLIWALNSEWTDSKNHKRIYNVLKNDSTIKICLVNYPTKGWR